MRKLVSNENENMKAGANHVHLPCLPTTKRPGLEKGNASNTE